MPTLHSLDSPEQLPFSELIGLVTAEKPHKTAWLINTILHLKLIRLPNAVVEYNLNKSMEAIYYEYKTVNNSYRLIRNRLVNAQNFSSPFLLGELHSYDYFFLIDNQTQSQEIAAMAESLKKNVNLQYVSLLEALEIKEVDNLIF